MKLRDVESLGFDDARDLFLREAGAHHAADPALPSLLEALDGHPLSIELLAANAAGKADLKASPPIGTTDTLRCCDAATATRG